MTSFSCERTYLEAIEKKHLRNILISEYCDQNFGYINLIDFYYRQVDSNLIIILLLVILVFPSLFFSISTAAEKYLAISMKSLSNQLRLSPSLAATTLVAFANGSPDILSTMASLNKVESVLLSTGTLLGSFVFTSTVVVANVVFRVPSQIALPRLALLKELGFYSLALIALCLLGFLRVKVSTFISVYLIIYMCYIITTIFVERILEKNRLELLESIKQDEEEGQLGRGTPYLKPDTSTLQVGQSDVHESTGPDVRSLNYSFMQHVYQEIFDPQYNLYRQLALLPLIVGGLFTVPYLDNPLMTKKSKFLVVFLGSFFATKILADNFESLFICGFAFTVTLLFIVLEYFKIAQSISDTLIELISVFSAIAWIKIISVFILDFVSFMAFYFSMEEITLCTIVISAGNSLADLFNNTALALHGEAVMGALASYSSQVFNTLIGLSINLVGNWRKLGNFRIDIFGRKSNAADCVFGLIPAKNLSIVVVLFFCFSIIIAKYTYFFYNSFVLKKYFGMVLISIYSAYFVTTICVGVWIRG